jgi:alkanesulfonate monooxygenase SsuD/methylene tetrahydromethanopterin reductase-like flavin-dependent oxidoreductase (luciferase family)
MELGYGLITCQLNPADPEGRGYPELYAQALELTERCERVGLASVWVSEHHFVDDGYLAASLPMLAAMAARTSRIDLGAGVILAPLFHPLRLAEDAIAVDLISRGRLILGLGLGWREEEFDGFGTTMRRRGRDLEEWVAILRDAFAPDGLAGPARVGVHPKPTNPEGPPIWIGAFSDRAIERAARIGDGFFGSVGGVDDLRARLDALPEPRRPFSTAAMVSVFPWDGPEDPWEVVREYQHYVSWKYADMTGARSRTGPPPPAPPLTPETEARLRERIICGRPEQVVEELRRFEPLLRGERSHIAARSYFPGMPYEHQQRVVDLLGQIAAELRA